MSERHRRFIGDADPRVVLTLISGLCPECGAVARPASAEELAELGIAAGEGWVHMDHAADCTVPDAEGAPR
jgi:hypothetical protein